MEINWKCNGFGLGRRPKYVHFFLRQVKYTWQLELYNARYVAAVAVIVVDVTVDDVDIGGTKSTVVHKERDHNENSLKQEHFIFVCFFLRWMKKQKIKWNKQFLVIDMSSILLRWGTQSNEQGAIPKQRGNSE